MPTYQVSEAARLLGVSPDTVRRWVDDGKVGATRLASGRRVIEGRDLARLAASIAAAPDPARGDPASTRNRFLGLVTAVQRDSVMTQVDLVCGPFRVVSLISREAADELGLEPGVIAVASIKATNVAVELQR